MSVRPSSDGVHVATSADIPRREGRTSAGWKKLAVVCIVALTTIEITGRVAHHLVRTRDASGSVPAGVRDTLRQKLEHDFLNPATRIEYAYDMFLGWRAKPNQRGLTYTINSSGMRDTRDYKDIQGAVVFLVGGSAAWSYGASDDEHTLAARLERKLNELRPGEPVRVLNLSEQAYGLRQDGIVVADWYTRIKPRVVLFYDGANDLQTIWIGKDPLHYRTWGAFPEILKGALREYTGQSWLLGPSDLRDLSMTWRIAQSAGSRIVNHGRGGERARFSAGQAEEIRAFFSAQLSHQHGLLHALGVRSVFVLPPIAYVDKPLHSEERSILNDEDAAWWPQAYGVLVNEYDAARQTAGVDTLSLVDLFEREPRQVYLDGFHMIDLGYELVAAALAPVVAEQLDEARPSPSRY